jgi:hypothetical protein
MKEFVKRQTAAFEKIMPFIMDPKKDENTGMYIYRLDDEQMAWLMDFINNQLEDLLRQAGESIKERIHELLVSKGDRRPS